MLEAERSVCLTGGSRMHRRQTVLQILRAPRSLGVELGLGRLLLHIVAIKLS